MCFRWIRRKLQLEFLSDTLKLYIGATLKVESLAGAIVIAPALFIFLVILLQVYYPPLGAVLFYAVFIPLVMGVAWIDFHRKHGKEG